MALIRGDGRDLRVDFFRGLALWWIYTDHIPGDVLGNYSLRDWALCDATEVFVLLAGYGAGIAYGNVMRRHGYAYAAADVLKRAWTLYIAHIFLFVVYSAQIGYSAAALARGNYLDESNLDVLGTEPYRALFEALTLRYQPSLLNILPLYIVLLVMFAAMLPLLRWPKILGVLSIAIYLVARAWGLNLPTWTGGGWFFDPLTWQLLFVVGALFAFHPIRVPATMTPVLDWFAGAVIVGSLIMIFGVWSHPAVAAALPQAVAHWMLSVDKTMLDPLRLCSIFALLWFVVRLIPREAGWLRGRLAAPLVLIGQHSLPVFCAGIFFGFFGRLGLEYNEGPLMQLLVNGGGAAGLVMVGAVAAWYGERGRARREQPAGSLPRPARADTGSRHGPAAAAARSYPDRAVHASAAPGRGSF